jgi:hypothetical protein
MSGGAAGHVMSSFGFKDGTDFGINNFFASFRLLGMRDLIFAAWFDQ